MFAFYNPPPPHTHTHPLHLLAEGIHNVAAIFYIPLIPPRCWDTKYGRHILYPLKDQRGDTEYGRHTEHGVTPVIGSKAR